MGLLVRMGRDHKALYLRWRSGRPKGRQFGLDGPSESAVPGSPLLLFESLQPGVSVPTPCTIRLPWAISVLAVRLWLLVKLKVKTSATARV